MNVLAASHSALSITTLKIQTHTITAEVADTASKRMTGLMNREYLPDHNGMLFIFPTTDRHCMWMKNTPLPLSVAFLDEAGRIINIADMSPKTLTAHCAAGPARYALEMNAHWFSARKIVAGDQVQIEQNVVSSEEQRTDVDDRDR